MSFLPPATITLGGGWGTNGEYYSHTSNGHYELTNSNGNYLGGKAIEFTDNNGALTLDVNPASNGAGIPDQFDKGTGLNFTSETVVAGDYIKLKKSDGSVKANFTVPDFYTGTSGGGGGTSTEETTPLSTNTATKKVFCNFW